MLKKILASVLLALLVTGIWVYNFAADIAAIVGGYASHTVCTNAVMLGRDVADIQARDLSYDQNRFTSSVVSANQVDTLVQLGPLNFTHTSVYRPGLGCSNLAGVELAEVEKISVVIPAKDTANERPWPVVSETLAGLNKQQLDEAVDAVFVETTDDIYQQQNTRAVLVHYKGELVAERYGEGFDGDTPLRGMSMTKSATSTLVGILVGQGKLDIHAPAPIQQWQGAAQYQEITTHHLLSMTGGFDYSEAYETDPRNLLNTMLMTQADMAAFAAKTPLLGQTGNYWDYQTVHSVLLQKVIRNTFETDQEYFRFAQKALFNKLGMTNSFFQADASGTFSGGAFMYASGRDWLRLGLLYLHDGVHDGEQILPAGWVEYATTPSEPSLAKRAYGAQIWLNAPSASQLFPGLPNDAYAFQGHYGQYVVVIPSLELVVARLGMTFGEGGKSFDKQAFLESIVASLTPIEAT